MRQLSRWAIAGVALLSGLLLTLPRLAEASTFGRGYNTGYFTGRAMTTCGASPCWDFVLSGGLEDVKGAGNPRGTFETDIKNYLYSGSAQDSTGAAFIIDTMLGHNGSDFSGPNDGINFAKNHFDKWKALVNAYDDAPASSGYGVVWGQPVVYNAGFQNSAYDPNIGDDGFYIDQTGQTRDTIRFFWPGGGIYEIKMNCGNVVDQGNPLPDAQIDGVHKLVTGTPGSYTVSGNVPDNYVYSTLSSQSGVDDYDNPYSWDTVPGTWTHKAHINAAKAPASYQILGYTWCKDGTAACNNLDKPNTMTTGSSFDINAADNGLYHVRWWYTNSTTGASCVSITGPSTALGGQVINVTAKIKNTGTTTWNAAAPKQYDLGVGTVAHPDDSSWAPLAPGANGNTTTRAAPLTGDIAGGATATFNFTATVPNSPGTHTLHVTIVHEGVGWLGGTCSLPVTVGSPGAQHNFWAASLINTPYQYVRDNFDYFYKLFTYFWPDAGDRRAGAGNKNLWLSGVWGVIAGDNVNSDNSQKAAPNFIASINTKAETNCPSGPTCLQRVPLAYVPQDDGSGNANSPCPALPTVSCADGSSTPHGNNWLAIKNMADGGNTTTNSNDFGFFYTPRLGGIASNQNVNVDGATGTIMKNVEISDIHTAAYGINDDPNANNCPVTGSDITNCDQGDIDPSSLQPDAGDQALDMPTGTQGPRAPGSNWTPSNSGCTGSHSCAAWDNLTFNSENSLANNQGFLPCQSAAVSPLPEFTCDPYNMLGSYASLVQYLTQDNVTSKLQDGQDGPDAGNHHQYPNPTEPMTYTNGVVSADNDVRLVWNEYDNWTQVDDKGHYYTNRGTENIGLDDGPGTQDTASIYYVSSYDGGSPTYETVYYQYQCGTDANGNPVYCTGSYEQLSDSYVCSSYPSSISYFSNNQGYYYGSYQTKYGWLNSNSTITGNAPYGGQGGSSPSYFYQGSYPASGNPSWATNNAGNMWQDPSVTAMSAGGASNPPSFAANGQWRYDTSDPVYNNRYVFDSYSIPFFYTGWYYNYSSICYWSNGGVSYGSFNETTATYYPNESLLYEYSSCPGDTYQGQCNVTYDGNKDGTVDTGWSWTNNLRRVQYEQTYTGHYRDFGPRSSSGSGDSELYGLSGTGSLTPASLARALATISNPVVALGTASNDIYGAAGISSYFNSSGCSPGCPSNFLFTNSGLIGFFSGSGYYYNYCVNPDSSKVDAYYPTNQSLSPTVCGNDVSPNQNAVDYVFPNYQTLVSSANQTLPAGSTLSGSFDLKGGIYYVNGDLHLNNVQFCTSGNAYKNINNISGSGGGTFIVTGNLYVDGSVSYCTGASDTQHLPSVGFIVGEPNPNDYSHGIIVASGVQHIVGAYFTNGVFSTCSIVNQAQNCTTGDNGGSNTTTNDVPFRLDGLVVADWFSLGRQLPAFGGAAATETFNYDGRVIVSPPPGFSTVLKQPASYSEAVPLN